MTAETISKKEYQHQINLLNQEVAERNEKIVSLNQEKQRLEEELAWFKRQIFGQRSERIASDLNSEQLTFDGFESFFQTNKEQKKTVKTHTRREPNRNGQDKITLPPDLPVQTTIIDIPEEQKICQETGQSLVQIGVEISHKLAHKPGSYYIKEIIRPKYANPQKEESGIIIAEMPDSLLPKYRADESLLAEIITKNLLIICLFTVSQKIWEERGLE